MFNDHILTFNSNQKALQLTNTSRVPPLLSVTCECMQEYKART